MKYTLTILYLLVGVVFGLSPVCREGGRLRSDLQFKYAYKESLSASKDIDFSQRAGESIFCNSAGTSVTASGVTKTLDCESVARSEGPGMDRFGWAKQLAVAKKGSVKVYSGDLNASPTEFTSGTECGSTIKMALGGHYMAAVCQKAVRVYRFDGSTWHDHEEISFPNANNHELKIDLNHEDYLIVSEPSSTTVKIYKLGVIRSEVQSLTGDGEVAAAVNCRGSVFAYESSGAVKIKQLSQKDGSWSDLTDIAVDPVSLSMSSDVLAVGLVNSANVYMFANSGTEYAEYKVLKGAQSFGKLVNIEHEDLAVLDDNRAYLFNDGASTKCRALQRLVDGACLDCGPGHTNAHDNTDATCNLIQCTASQYALGGVCKACPSGSTGVAGPANVDSECTCAAGKSFDAAAGTCNAILCAADERVVSNACEACPAGSTNAAGDDSSGADTNCDATLCGANEHVVSNACTPCAEGSTNAAGDDASGADTACDITHQCLVNQFYDTVNHCQACPAGTEKAVAVDSTGGNSTCDDVLCLADHSVQIGYNSDNTKKYGSTSCSSTSDCQSKCTANSGCAGYTTIAAGAVTERGTPIQNAYIGVAEDADGNLYYIGGTKLYKLDTSGTETSVGDISGSGYSILHHNNYIYVGAGSKVDQYNIATDTMWKSWFNFAANAHSLTTDGTYLFVVGHTKMGRKTLSGSLSWQSLTTAGSTDRWVDISYYDSKLYVYNDNTQKIYSMGIDGTSLTEVWNAGTNLQFMQVYDSNFIYAKSSDNKKILKKPISGGTEVTLATTSNSAFTGNVQGDKLIIAINTGKIPEVSLKTSASYGPLVTGTGTSFTKGKVCTTCHPNATRPAGDLEKGPLTQCSCKPNFEGDGSTCTACGANQESAGGGDKCKCSAGFEGDGTACQACPANSAAVVGPIKDQCVKNEDAIWFDEIVNNLADAGACLSTLDCTSKAATNGGCIQPYEDGGVLQATTACCKIEKPAKCLCEENFRVSSNACVACPTGETRPAGDDPDNGNTYCNTEGITLSFTHNGNDDFVYNGQNDPDINLKIGQKYTFLRDSAGHPLRVVSEADCSSCSTGEYTSLPTSSVSSVDAQQGVANVVVTFKKAGTYYYVCTAHSKMVGKLIVAWDACSINAQGSTSLTSSCQIQSSLSLTGAVSISVASARLRSTGDKILLSMSSTVSPAINAGVYAVSLSGVEITDIASDNELIKSTSGTISLSGVDIKDNPRNAGTGALFRSAKHIVAQSLNVVNSKGILLQAESGGDISLADSIISESGDIIKQNGGAVVVRGVTVTGGGKLADMEDATSIFEAVTTNGGDGIKAVKSAVQIERSDFKGHTNAPVQFDSRSCSKCKRELVISETKFQDSKAVNVDSDSANKPVVKIIEGNFTSSGSVVASNGISLYVIDEIDGKEMTTTETKTESCLANQCSHKPLATSCKVSPGKGTKCVCDVGVATYKVQEKELDKQTTVEEILSMLFATADTADRIVKLVDENVRYIPTQATPEEAKSNILLLKPSNTDGEFQSEKTILLKPDSGSVCATFQTWLCAELTACHYANGTITADCDGKKILTGSSNAARRFRLRSTQHPDDPNCNGAIANLRQQCQSGSTFYSRCVKHASFRFDQCVCNEGLEANSAGTACLAGSQLCGVNERVQSKTCVPCADGLMNKAGDDSSGADTQCDDVVCEENFKADGSGNCVACAVGEFNLAGDVAKEGQTDQTATTCCGSGEYEFSFDGSTRTCKACGSTTAGESLRDRFGVNGGGLHCCRGVRLSSADKTQCDRIMQYYRRICQPLESATTCPAQSYK